MTLFIIGNGFDLNHGYKTSYIDFRAFLEKRPYYIGDFNLYEPFESFDDSEWNNFEDELENIDFYSWGSYYSDGLSENLSDKDFEQSIKNNNYLIDEFNNFEEKLPIRLSQALENFIVEAIENFDAKPKDYFKKLFDTDSVFINFNYTKLLENLYSIDCKRIEYIHGLAKNISYDEKKGFVDYSKPQIIFGHGNFFEKEHDIFGAEYDNNIFSPHNSLMYLNDKLKKEYKINRLEDFISLNSNISNIEIIGHSMGEIDCPYFRRLNELVDKSVKITYWLYDRKEEKDKKNVLESLFSGHNIKMVYYP